MIKKTKEPTQIILHLSSMKGIATMPIEQLRMKMVTRRLPQRASIYVQRVYQSLIITTVRSTLCLQVRLFYFDIFVHLKIKFRKSPNKPDFFIINFRREVS